MRRSPCLKDTLQEMISNRERHGATGVTQILRVSQSPGEHGSTFRAKGDAVAASVAPSRGRVARETPASMNTSRARLRHRGQTGGHFFSLPKAQVQVNSMFRPVAKFNAKRLPKLPLLGGARLNASTHGRDQHYCGKPNCTAFMSLALLGSRSRSASYPCL